MIVVEIFLRFGLVSLLAFGAGAGVSLIERTSVGETGWVGEREFAAAFSVGQVTPGPTMVVATFVGYRAAGLSGALAATLGIFLAPWGLATLTARHLDRHQSVRWLAGFRSGAMPAAVGLLAVTVLGVGRQSVTQRADAAIAVAALVVALRTRTHPFWVLALGAIIGLIFDRG